MRGAQSWWGHFVADWGGFEELIAELSRTGSITVEHNVKLVGHSGASHQVDVLLRHRLGQHEHLIVIDCKYWRSRVSRAHVDAFATTVRALGASRGVLFSVAGFVSDAIAQALQDGIELFQTREPTGEQCGIATGRTGLYLTYISKSFANLAFPDLYMLGLPAINFNFQFGDSPSTSTRTPIQPIEGLSESTLEGLVLAEVDEAARRLWPPAVLFDGREGERLFWQPARATMASHVVAVESDRIVFIPGMAFDIALKVTQTRFTPARGNKYALILAIDDCIRGITKMAGERRDTPNSGAVFALYLQGFFPFAEVSDLAPGVFRDTIKPE